MGNIHYDYYSLGVGVNFICQFDWAKGQPRELGVSMRVFAEEISVLI